MSLRNAVTSRMISAVRVSRRLNSQDSSPARSETNSMKARMANA